jgi:hypothetical protein
MKKKIIKGKIWKKEFNQIKDKEEFIEYYCDFEDKWLQYSDWDKKIKGIFGSYKNAVLSFYESQGEAKHS